jgi:hypothetical protein
LGGLFLAFWLFSSLFKPEITFKIAKMLFLARGYFWQKAVGYENAIF